MGHPAGLKLNGRLTTFLGELYMWLLIAGQSKLSTLQEQERLNWTRRVVYLAAIESYQEQIDVMIDVLKMSPRYIGPAMTLALMHDLLALALLPWQSAFVIARRIFSWHSGGLLSLLRVFRGKKWDTLRNRVDDAEYDSEQLLLSTLLLTILVFLYPTVTVYYLLFCIVNHFSLRRGYRIHYVLTRSWRYCMSRLELYRSFWGNTFFKRRWMGDAKLHLSAQSRRTAAWDQSAHSSPWNSPALPTTSGYSPLWMGLQGQDCSAFLSRECVDRRRLVQSDPQGKHRCAYSASLQRVKRIIWPLNRRSLPPQIWLETSCWKGSHLHCQNKRMAKYH